jgi:hypothetical protein
VEEEADEVGQSEYMEVKNVHYSSVKKIHPSMVEMCCLGRMIYLRMDCFVDGLAHTAFDEK